MTAPAVYRCPSCNAGITYAPPTVTTKASMRDDGTIDIKMRIPIPATYRGPCPACGNPIVLTTTLSVEPS